MHDLVPRSTIEAMAGHRNKALELFETAWQKIRDAADAVETAQAEVKLATDGHSASNYMAAHAPEIEAFDAAVQRIGHEQYARVAKRTTDIRCWAAVVASTDLDHIMDKQAKDELRSQMAYVPEETNRDGQLINAEEIAKGLPEFTADNVRGTLEAFAQDSGAIFRRGLANAFAKLDRRFRSHDGFKIGGRMILERAFQEVGKYHTSLFWNHYAHHQDTLCDIERVFLVLDGKGPRAQYGGIVGAIDQHRGETDFPINVKGDYFRVRIFKNGNAHLWFERKDLLRKVNLLLAEHYGAVVGDGVDNPEHQANRPLENRKMTVARNFGLFPTPDKVVQEITSDIPMTWGDSLRILEPSAGTGSIARYLAGDRDVNKRHRVTCVEIQPDLAQTLTDERIYHRVFCGDFLQMDRPHMHDYDWVVMNPPFDRERDIDHVTYAWQFVKPGGHLVAVMSASTEWRETRKSEAFREFVAETTAFTRWGGTTLFRDLPQGAFRESGTETNTLWIHLKKKEME